MGVETQPVMPDGTERDLWAPTRPSGPARQTGGAAQYRIVAECKDACIAASVVVPTACCRAMVGELCADRQRRFIIAGAGLLVLVVPATANRQSVA